MKQQSLTPLYLHAIVKANVRLFNRKLPPDIILPWKLSLEHIFVVLIKQHWRSSVRGGCPMVSEQPQLPTTSSGTSHVARISRRTFLEHTVAVAASSSVALTLLEGCSSPAPGGTSTDITYWNLFGGGDGVRMIQMENDFAKAFPHINVESVTLAWGDPYYTKLAMAASGGRPPEVAISHITRMPTYAAQGLLEPYDLTELAQYDITENNFFPSVWQRGQYNGKLYAVPLDTHPFVMYYNTDICKKAGLLDADGNLKPIQGPDGLINTLKTAQQAIGPGGYGVAFEVEGVTLWRLFYSLYSQLGGTVSFAGGQLTLDEAKAEQALSFMAELTTTSKVAPPNIDYGGAVALFGSGKAAFHWNGEWEVTTFITQKTPFNMVPFPQVYDTYYAQADSHSFVLPRQIAIDPARRAASLQFISFLLKDSYTWAQGGHIPAYLPTANSSDYKNLKPQSNYASVAAHAVVDPSAWFSGSGSELENKTQTIFGPAMSGQATPAQSMQQWRAAIQKLLNTRLPF
jgi:multiple sugar transport system substrate-binding protein